MYAKKIVEILVHENDEYLGSINRFSSSCDEIIDTSEIIPINFNEKKVNCKTENFYIHFRVIQK